MSAPARNQLVPRYSLEIFFQRPTIRNLPLPVPMPRRRPVCCRDASPKNYLGIFRGSWPPKPSLMETFSPTPKRCLSPRLPKPSGAPPFHKPRKILSQQISLTHRFACWWLINQGPVAWLVVCCRWACATNFSAASVKTPPTSPSSPSRGLRNIDTVRMGGKLSLCRFWSPTSSRTRRQCSRYDPCFGYQIRHAVGLSLT